MAEQFREEIDQIAERLGGRLDARLADQAKAYEAQAEAYEKVSDALIKINAEIRALDTKSSDLRSETKGHLRELLKGVVVIGEQLRTHHEITKSNDQNQERRLDDLIKWVAEFARNSAEREQTLGEIIERVTAANTRIGEQLERMEEYAMDSARTLTHVKDDVLKTARVTGTIGWVFTVTAALFVLLQGLIQLQILKIEWFAK